MQKRTPDALEDRLSRPGPAEREHFAKLRALCLGAGLDENGNLVQLRGPLFLDFEASSLSSASWPIEVGISRLLEGRRIVTQSKLIKPRASWPEDDWDPKSEEVHGIKRSELNEGEDPDAVSRWILNEAKHSALVSDAPEYDQKWLDRLLGQPGPQVAYFDEILWDERWSCFFDQFSAGLSYSMGFMSGGGFQCLGWRIIGLGGRQQPVR